MAASAMKVKDATVDLPIPEGEKKSRLFVWDRKTGNVASKAVGDLGTEWKVKPEEFDTIGQTTVRIEHDGQPVAVAFVNLKEGADQRDSQIDATKKGEAVFFGLKPGNLDVTVRYNVKGTDAPPVKQSFVLDMKRSQPNPIFIVSLTDDVETVGANLGTLPPGGQSGKGGQTAAPEKKVEGGSVIGSILTFLLALGAAGAAIYFGMRYIKQNQDQVGEQLKKMGVQIPDPVDPNQADPGSAPVPVPPSPPQKIILDDADPNVPPTPLSVPTAAPVAPIAPVSVGQPSLIMENGDVFPIPDGETTVGREAGNGLSLVAESTVSRKHASVVRSGNDVLVRDLGSSNGTFVNGVKIATDTSLRPGDQVQFGQVRFRYEA